MRAALEQRIGWRMWFVGVTVFVAFLVFVLPAEADRTVEAAGTSETPDTSYLYTAEDLQRLAREYGEEGRAHYIRSRFTFDVAWPLVYGFFLQSSLLLVSRRTVLHRLPSLVVLLPILVIFFDLLENSSASIVMARYPDSTPIAAQAAPVFTFMKWNLLIASFALVKVGALAGFTDLVRKRWQDAGR